MWLLRDLGDAAQLSLQTLTTQAASTRRRRSSKPALPYRARNMPHTAFTYNSSGSVRSSAAFVKSHIELYRSLGARHSATSLQGKPAPARSGQKEVTAN